jgi:protein-disulfide isomerase
LQTAPQLEETYVSGGQVRWIVLPYALSPRTVPAAAAAMCAAEQGSERFQQFHQAMFEMLETDQALIRAGFLTAATQAELDDTAFTTCIDADRYNSTVQANSRAAAQVGVTGTPTFFINDQELEGAWPFSEFQRRIEAFLR